jgi:signal transduction histidine kinase
VPGRLGIRFKITVLLVMLLVVAVSADIIWSNWSQTNQAEKEMLEKTKILDQEMHAVWDFIDINQKRIDTDANGEYNFKNIYCAVAGKSVAKLFMRENDYEVRYVSETPRYSAASPDEFEAAAIQIFNDDFQSGEYYGITTYEGRDVFRYVSPLYIKESCLACHGDPKGEIDVTGHAKEGLRLGDLAGVTSIIMPINLYMEGIKANIWQQAAYFTAVLTTLIVIAYVAITYLLRRLEKANLRLQEESQYKSDFLAIMSHELRTPLTSILAFTEIWEKNASPDDKGGLEAVREVRENSGILLEMINNILEAARFEAGKTELHREWVDMVDLLSTVEVIIGPLAERKGLDFATKVAADVPLIYADWEKLRRIVENLASNAIKFTQPGGRVDIDVERDGTEILMRVSDTGIGIREEDTQRLFQKFMQLDQSAQRRYRGSGLGLAVVKELTDAHGGWVEVFSLHKQGSTFSVHIPIGEEIRKDSHEGDVGGR